MTSKISIDTCILFDLLLNQNTESIEKIRQHYENHDEMVICGIVYGELSPYLKKHKIDIDLFLSELDIKIENCTNEDYAYAGQRWFGYCQKRKIVCQKCGKPIKIECTHCYTEIRFRQHILSDFVIGAFSEKHCDGLLTRDYGYYKTYFPKLKRL